MTPKSPRPTRRCGTLLGPAEYDAKAGAFIASPDHTGIRDLAHEDWRAAFAGADNAMASYPLLVAVDGADRIARPSRWLANRSFVGQDAAGRIILGTTADAYYSLDRLAAFLHQAPLGVESDKAQLLIWPYGTVAMPIVLAVFPR